MSHVELLLKPHGQYTALGTNTLKVLSYGIVLLVMMLSPVVSMAQDDSQSAVLLREKLSQLHALRVQRIELAEQLAQQQKQSDQTQDRLTHQVQQSQHDAQHSKQQNQKQREQLDKLQDKIAADMQWLIGTAQIAEQQSIQINESVTLDDHSITRLADIRKAITSESQRTLADSHQSFDATPDMVQWLQSQRQLARRVELSNRPVTLNDGRVLHAYVLRIGAVGEYFVLEDESLCGYRTPAGWQTDLSQSQHQNLAKAINTMRGQLPPALLSLPLPITKAGE